MPYAALFSSSSNLAAQPPHSIISGHSRCRQSEAALQDPNWRVWEYKFGCVVSLGVVAAQFCDGQKLLFLLSVLLCLCCCFY